jgi:DNA-binding XRE family transcriptional regulator
LGSDRCLGCLTDKTVTILIGVVGSKLIIVFVSPSHLVRYMASSKSKQGPEQRPHAHAEEDDVLQQPPQPGNLTRDRIQTNPDLFTGGSTARVPSSLPLLEASNILTQRKHLPWQTDPDGKLSYIKDFDKGEGAIHFWVTNETESDHPVGLASAAALAVIDTFDIRAACMHLIYAAYAAQVENPWEHEIVVDDRQLEKYLGLHRRTDLNRQQKIELIRDLVEQPCKITTFITWKSTAKQKGLTVAEGRLWHLIETRYHYQQHLLEDQKDIAGITFVIRPGSWAKHFLSESAADHNHPSQQSHLSKALLEGVMSVWQHREGAARLMIWLLFKSQTNKRYPYEVKTLMEVAYGSERLHQALVDRKIRSRIANAWDEDLFTLKDQGWGIFFDDTTYPIEIRPFGLGRDETNRRKGFFEQLLGAKLWISPPEEWFSLSLPQTADSLENEAEDQPVTLTGADVKSLRKERGWSQRKLASFTGISQSLISLIEKGERQISSDTEAALQKAFDFM